ncbi:MAP kinase-activated protein kinase 2 (Fragment) [Seminavis robusta]|uniref:MAP kinase-activated protein kinase 2 n=1 Tax=Seminavis robusta TaxID=568900 RepID=A0A9N8EEN2_9STRA
MSCFHLCWKDPRERVKVGPFIEYASASAKRNDKEPRGIIPWVHSRSFHHTYELRELLGSGSFAVVHSAITREPPFHSYAVKVIQRKKLLTHKALLAFKDEVQIMATLQHGNIIQLHELYKERDFFFVVLEKLEGGELFDRLCERSTYTEKNARDAMRMIFEAVAYCHSQQVAHRDLKPENCLLKDTSEDSLIKVADFGFAKFVERPNSLRTLLGSPSYTAPEIINYIPYDERADNWSLGVILFTVLGGYPPFYHPTIHGTFQQIRQGSYSFLPDFWTGISPDAKNLIKGLLTRDPRERTTSEQALQHPWMTGRGELLEQRCLSNNQERLQDYNSERKRERRANAVRSASMYWLVSRR